MKKQSKLRTNKEKGITLIALVTTIVVLLILAGVSIVVLFGDNGIIKMAQEAAEQTNQTAQDEQKHIKEVNDKINSGEWGDRNEEEKTLVSEITKNYDENQKAEDIYGNKIVIPAGFEVVQHGTDEVEYTYAEGENKNKPTVQDGIVIQDDDGNQFVWIPVGKITNKVGEPTTITLGRYKFDANTATIPGLEHLVQSAEEFKSTEEDTNDLTYQQNYSIDEHMELTERIRGAGSIAKDLATFTTKTNANGGYYLARYEASFRRVEENGNTIKKPYSVESQGDVWQDNSSPSKYNDKQLWNFAIREEASSVSQAMYKNDKFESDLVNSYSWDTAIVFIQKYSEGNSNYSNQTQKATGIILNTGEKGKTTDKVCNIYNMASNLWEWTTEYSNAKSMGVAYPLVCRGAYHGGNNYTPSTRGSTYQNSSRETTFRPILYFKTVNE